VADAEPIEHSRPKLLDEHVVLRHESFERAYSLPLPEIDDRASLAAVQTVKGRALPIDEGRERARIVAGIGVLDLVNARPEISENERAERARKKTGEIEDANACERRHASAFYAE
jgi:hypothetical protein